MDISIISNIDNKVTTVISRTAILYEAVWNGSTAAANR